MAIRALIEGVDYFPRYIRFANKANPAMVAVNEDGTFDIYLNTLYEPGQLAEALEHELRHLEAEHFYVDLPIAKIERQADGEPLNVIGHAPEGRIVHFPSLAAFAHYVKALAAQQGVDLDALRWEKQLEDEV